MSISQVFLKGKSEYHLHEDVAIYFFFSTLGGAVPLRPGDYLMFNALIPRCISSHCKLDNKIMCVSMYLKTSTVDMNNNNIMLTPTQSLLADKFHSNKLTS
jgi:hypothetical protein